MKKILLFASALAGLFLAGSCQKENLESAGNTVSFTVEAPGAMATKAIADGLNVNEVHYEVYKNVEGVEHALLTPGSKPMAKGVVEMVDNKANITLDLLQDQKYTVIFWAQVAGKGHYDTSDLRCIELAQNHQVYANDETRAAFFKRFDFNTYEHKDYPITLIRPFAQLNLLTTMESLKPVSTGQTSGYEIDAKQSQIIVTGLAASFNTVTGVGNGVDYPFTFNMADTPEEQGQATLTVNEKAYHYVSMNYMFVPVDAEDGSATVGLKYEIVTDKGSINHEIENVPIKENYRTNVIGNLFTKESTFEIVVDPNFGGQELVPVWDQREVSEPAKVNGQYVISTASELAWLSAAVNGTLPVVTKATEVPAKQTFKNETFVLLEDINLENIAWTPIGANGTFEGAFDGQNHTISNLNVATEGKTPAGLFANAKYVSNLTINGAKVYGHYKVGTVVGDGLCSRIENCHVYNAEVVATTYNNNEANHVGGIVGYLSAENTAYVKNSSVSESTISGYRDVAALVGTATRSTGNSAVITGNQVSNVTVIADQTAEYGEQKDCNAGEIVGRNNAATLANNDAENVTVIRKVDATEELAYAVAEAQSGDTIYVGGEVTMPYFAGKALNFEGLTKSAVVKQSPATHIDEFYAGAELNFSNLTLVGTSYQNNTQGYQKAVKETYTNCHFVDYIMFAGDVTTVNNCTFASTVGQYFWTGTADVITFNECNFDVLERAIKVCTVGNDGAREVNINNCHFEADNQVKAAIEIDGSKGSSYVVNINGCTNTGFAAGANTNDTLFNVEGAENVTVNVDGKKWASEGIFVTEDGTKYYSNTTGLNAALDAAQAGDVINLLPGEFAPASYKAGVKLIGTSADKVKVNVEGKKFGLGGGDVYIENVTLKFANVNYAGFQHTGNEIYMNCVIEGQPFLYGNKVKFENCTFKQASADAYNVWTYGAKEVEFNGCIFNSAGKSVLVYCEDNTLESKVTFKGCELNASGSVEGKAAIEIDGSLVKKYVVNINDTKANDFAAGSVSKSTLWNIKKDNNNVEVYVNKARVIADGVVLKAVNEYELNAANGLFWFAEQVNANGNSFSGKTVKLAANIDLKNAAWTPVGQTGGYSAKTYFQGTFDGNGKTISNLTIVHHELGSNEGKNYATGFFGFIDAGSAVIKDVTFDKANVTGHHWTGVIAGYLSGNITGCVVKNSTILCTHLNGEACGDKAGAIVGYINTGLVSETSATDCSVKAGRDAGQIVGASKPSYVSDCAATNVTVEATGDCTGANVNNAVIGRLL